MMKNFLYFLLMCLLFSCSENNKSAGTLAGLFAEQCHVDPEEMALEFDSIRNPYMMNCVSRCIVLADMFQPDFITVFDEESGRYEGSFLARGNGPDEFVHLSGMQRVGNKLFLWDTGQSEAAFIGMNRDTLENYTCRLVPIRQDSTFVSAFQVFPLDEECFVSSGVIKGHRLAVLDKTGKATAFFGEYPKPDTERERSDVELALANQCFYAYHPGKHVLAVANGMGEHIQFYDMSNKKAPQLIKEYGFSSPQYKMDGEGSVVYQKENVIGFIGLSGHPDYCIGLFSGNALESPDKYGGDKLLCFDWEGNPVRMLRLGNRFSNMAMSEDGDKAYLLGKDRHTDDFRIYMLNLSAGPENGVLYTPCKGYEGTFKD